MVCVTFLICRYVASVNKALAVFVLDLHAKEVLLHEQSYVTPLQTWVSEFFFLFGMISIQPQPETALEKSLAPREKIRYDVGIQVAATI